MMQIRLVLRGPPLEAGASLARFILSVLRACLRRALFGPQRPSWPLNFEIATFFFRAQGRRAFHVAGDGAGLPTARRLIDTFIFRLPHFYQVRIVPEIAAPIRGRWFIADQDGPLVLHFHGGGYVFSPATTDNLVAAVACAIGGRTFVPDYRLAPEHPFPCQLDDALASYEWLLGMAALNRPLVVTGDSSGGHLALALLLALCEKGLRLPDATIAISPWTEPGGGGASLSTNAPSDWMTDAMLKRMAAWAGMQGGADHPLFRLTQADLSPLQHVLVHVGGAEICLDMVQRLAARARAAGADVTCEVWPDMNHNFHGFGDLLPQSRQALEKIASFVAQRVAKATYAQSARPLASAPPRPRADIGGN